VDKLQAAQLQVVLPGTRASFRRRVIDAARELVAASGGFCFFGKEDSLAYDDGTRLVDGASRAMGEPRRLKLSAAFGIDRASVVASPRRAYASNELWPEKERAALPYFRDVSSADGFSKALVLFIHEGGVLFGLAGLERRANEPNFSSDERGLIEKLAPFVVAGARAQLQYDELSREAAALRALGKMTGAVYVVDRDRKRVLWAADRERGIDWDEDVAPIADQLVAAAEEVLEARAQDVPVPTPPKLANGTVVAVSKLEGDPVFGVARCAVVRVDPASKPGVIDSLSRREREIARLLVAGYSGVNVAAVSGLSENTVRTYVRRLYAKLGVNSRADLVRRLVTPEPRPASSDSVTPDSSLADGDDTLD
jgi:DNA-binding CsgD family transcriptional regulator